MRNPYINTKNRKFKLFERTDERTDGLAKINTHNLIIHFKKIGHKKKVTVSDLFATVVPTKSDSDVIFCLHLLSKTLTCTLHWSYNR